MVMPEARVRCYCAVMLAWSVLAEGCIFFHLGTGDGAGGTGGVSQGGSGGAGAQGAGGSGGSGGSDGSPPIPVAQLSAKGGAVAWNGILGAVLEGDDGVVRFDSSEPTSLRDPPLSPTGAIAVLPDGAPLVPVSNGQGAGQLFTFGGEKWVPWPTTATISVPEGVAVLKGEMPGEDVVLVVDRVSAVLHLLAPDGASHSQTGVLDGEAGQQVTARLCGGDGTRRVAWTAESSVGAWSLRLTTIDGTVFVAGDTTLSPEPLGRPAIEEDCSVVVPVLNQDMVRYRRLAQSGLEGDLMFSAPNALASAHVAAAGSKLLLTVAATSLAGVEVLSCPSGAATPADCRQTNLGCGAIGGLATDGVDVFFTCDVTLYRWSLADPE
jgi:hypothetical protein